jgi:hypothetical protein
MKVVRTLGLIFFCLLSLIGRAQNSPEVHLDEHKNHLGLALGPVYIISEDEFAPGMHLHYARLFDIGKMQ